MYRIATILFLIGSVASAQDAQKCARLTEAGSFPNPKTAVASASFQRASAAKGRTPALPEHCEVFGTIDARTGANGQNYAIHFHLRLPSVWNGRFFFEGGGGSNGNLGNAFGNLQGQQRKNALELGYAVVSQDSGHDNRTNNDPKLNGTLVFGFDPQARLDFGYNSYDQVAQAAKALIGIYYGRPPQRSYYVGCSEGGREGMMMSQRFPTYFDGILACSPGFELPKAALAEAWDTQAFAGAAKAAGIYDRSGEPLLNKTFTDEDLALVSQTILDACDGLDGLKDGIIGDFPACASSLVEPKLSAVVCRGPKGNGCLSQVQVTALEKVFEGAKDSKGKPIYSDWPWDRGIGGPSGSGYNQGWRIWKIGAFGPPKNSAINATLGSEALSALFTTPPVPVAASGAAPLEYLLRIDFDKDASAIYAKSGKYTESSWNFMMASSTDLSSFKKHGGKLVIVQGVSDPIFSIDSTIAWWNEVNRKNAGVAAGFVRLFAVPGMNHCAGGPATDRFDAFTALVNWVEKGEAPKQIEAAAGPASPWPGRTRPLCPYPQQARYSGSGSIEDAKNFSCR